MAAIQDQDQDPDPTGEHIQERYYDYLESRQIQQLMAMYRPESNVMHLDVDTDTAQRANTLPDIEHLITSLEFTDINPVAIVVLHRANFGSLSVAIGSLRITGVAGRRVFMHSVSTAPLANTQFILYDAFCLVGNLPDQDTSSVNDGTDPSSSSCPPANVVRRQPGSRNSDVLCDITNTRDSSTLPSEKNALNNDRCSIICRLDPQARIQARDFSTQLAFLKSKKPLRISAVSPDEVLDQQQLNLKPVNKVLDTEPVNAGVEEPVASAENTITSASAKQPPKRTFADAFLSGVTAQPSPSAVAQCSSKRAATTNDGQGSVSPPSGATSSPPPPATEEEEEVIKEDE